MIKQGFSKVVLKIMINHTHQFFSSVIQHMHNDKTLLIHW